VRVAGPSALNLSPAWLPDGRHLLFISSHEGPRDLYVATLDRRGRPRGEPQRLTAGLDAATVTISRDGTRAAYTHFTGSRNIYTLAIPRRGPARVSAARPLTRGSQLIGMHALSPDGRWLAYQSDRSGNQDIWIMPAAGGGEPRQVTRDPHDDMGPDFSPDGSEIAFYSTRHGSRDLFVINVDGTGETRVTTGRGEALLPDFSPDGTHLVFDAGPSMSARGIAMVARERVGASWSVPTWVVPSGALGARWAPDGQRFAYWRLGPMALATRSLSGEVRLLTDTNTVRFTAVGRIAWAPDGDTLYYAAATGRWGIYRSPAAGGVPELLVRDDDPAKRLYADGLTVGNGLLYLTLGEYTSDIYVLELRLPR
jgi:dipeptidyl aminopeptidase/acylaminoacyl peptidase